VGARLSRISKNDFHNQDLAGSVGHRISGAATMTPGKRWIAAPLLLTMACAPAAALAKNEKTWGTASDIGAYGLTAVALGLPLVRQDTKGALQAAGSVAAASLVTTGLKEAFPELRPDGSDRKSFPSGHTSMAFSAAASLYMREGKSIGIPAFVVASFVGLARVKADKHHWYDVVAGAGIGGVAGLLITKQPDRQAALIPWGDTKGGGVSFAMRF
jgi:membrane-associated phospholipid phosphatase